MNTKQIFRNIFRTVGTAALLLCAGFASCSEDDDIGSGSYFRLENIVVSSKQVTSSSELGFDVNALVGDPTLELIRYDIRSNGKWTAECNSSDADWLRIWPDHGEGDGKIRFCITDNDHTQARATTVVFRYGDGRQTETTLAVNQAANTPYITVSATTGTVSVDAVEVERAASCFTVTVQSNVDFFYSATKADWFTFEELGNGLFQLDIQAYPDNAETLERSGKIAFKGVGEFSSITAELPIHQSIVPYIQTDLKGNSIPEFAATSPTAETFTLKSNYAWTITPGKDDTWYSVSPMSGDADKTYTITVTPLKSNTSSDQLSGKMTVTANTAELGINVSQEAGAGGPVVPVEGLPVVWSFPENAETDGMVSREERWYQSDDRAATISIVQPERNPSNPNMSFTLNADGELGRLLSYGFCLDDYWLFTIPVKHLRSNTKVQLNTLMSSSAAGPKFFMLEYSTDDMETWNSVNEKTTTLAGRDIKHTIMLPYVSAANEDYLVNEVFPVAKSISSGTLYIRLRVCDTRSNKNDKEIIAKNGGTTRLKTKAGSCEQISVQIIE